MPERSTSIERLVRWLVLTALVILGLLALVDGGATRIYATPWNALFWFIQLVPIVGLALRAVFSAAASFRFPPWQWAAIGATFAVVLELSAILSPFRGVSVWATAEPLAGIASFLLVYDWLARDPHGNGSKLLLLAGYFSCLLVLGSLLLWIFRDLRANVGTTDSLAGLLRIQNAHPLGHTSYTAGLALLALPWPMVLAIREQGRARLWWSAIGALAVGMLLSSGSRGGIIGFVALILAAVWLARWSWKRTLLGTFGLLLIAIVAAYAHPRTRTLLLERAPSEAAPNLSNVQRAAMAKAGWLMGRARPLLGWGTGTTSRVYPKFRSQLDGGVEDALQLHSTPVQLWADLGIAGSVCVSALGVLTIGAAFRGRRELGPGGHRSAFDACVLTLAGYGAFCLTDYQLDVPVFAFGLAVCVACVAALTRGEVTPPTTADGSRSIKYIVGACALSPLLLIATLGKPDPTPELNVRALELATDASQADQAIALLRESLQLNPDQEIAHFNLGWLLVVRAPADAERHFLAAAQLVPDKGGVYFGLALARINRGAAGDAEKATRALALECLNDPIFLVSPWWENPALRPLRASAVQQMQQMAETIRTHAASRRNRYVQHEAEYAVALADWLAGRHSATEMTSIANTNERRIYFGRNAAMPDFHQAKVRKYRRERTGYPILMRDLDLPPPVDLFDVQENDLAAGELRFLFPAKGWVPSPELVKLLQ